MEMHPETDLHSPKALQLCATEHIKTFKTQSWVTENTERIELRPLFFVKCSSVIFLQNLLSKDRFRTTVTYYGHVSASSCAMGV